MTYHLYPKLVDPPAADTSDEPSVLLCKPHCYNAAVASPKVDSYGNVLPPSRSLAAGTDFGDLTVLGLPPLSDIERLLLSDVRMYAIVQKIVGPDWDQKNKPHWHKMKAVGHFIAFMHSGPKAVEQFFAQTMAERVEDLVRKVR